jgi:hypothetical protein
MLETTRRRAFIPLLAAALFASSLLAASLFRIDWFGAGQSLRVCLQGGSLRLWIGSRGDFSALAPGVHAGGWSGPQHWAPEIEAARKYWIQAGPTPTAGFPGGVVPAKQIIGLHILIPLYLLVLPLLLLAAAAFPPYRRHRRAARGLCRACGYDLRGLRDRCPECGRALLALILRLLRASPWGAPRPW